MKAMNDYYNDRLKDARLEELFAHPFFGYIRKLIFEKIGSRHIIYIIPQKGESISKKVSDSG